MLKIRFPKIVITICLTLLAVSVMTGCSGGQKQQVAITPTEFDPEYTAYGRVLTAFIKGEKVDYRQLQSNRADLDRFVSELAGLKASDLLAMPRDDQMALWINAYNGLTLRSIIDAYPVKSIKDIDGVWDKRKWPVAGRKVTIDQVEHEILRPEFKDPLVHFAVNCAAIGCPPLLNQPFRGTTLNTQLNQMASAFANNDERNRIDFDRKNVSTTEIFSWFGEDFVGDYRPSDRFNDLSETEAAALGFVFAFYADTAMAQAADQTGWSLEYYPYDWSLNDIER